MGERNLTIPTTLPSTTSTQNDDKSTISSDEKTTTANDDPENGTDSLTPFFLPYWISILFLFV